MFMAFIEVTLLVVALVLDDAVAKLNKEVDFNLSRRSGIRSDFPKFDCALLDWETSGIHAGNDMTKGVVVLFSKKVWKSNFDLL